MRFRSSDASFLLRARCARDASIFAKGALRARCNHFCKGAHRAHASIFSKGALRARCNHFLKARCARNPNSNQFLLKARCARNPINLC